MDEQSGVWVQQTKEGKAVFSVMATEDGGTLRVGYTTVEPRSDWADEVKGDMEAFARHPVRWAEVSYEEFFMAVFMFLPGAVDVLWLDGDPLPLTEAGLGYASGRNPGLWEMSEGSPNVWGRTILERVLRGLQDEELKATFRAEFQAGLDAAYSGPRLEVN